ncbi:hypothetical protein JOB18_046830 [Solea senegalensis]|uniref:Uncharacterized protein n=1 Tax=Solea senegalensis TaxID=28829 RepID=A0AAV6QXW5_SOLSE|nr:hypothetical protein JOB18_046830 [Solea senegalensis]
MLVEAKATSSSKRDTQVTSRQTQRKTTDVPWASGTQMDGLLLCGDFPLIWPSLKAPPLPARSNLAAQLVRNPLLPSACTIKELIVLGRQDTLCAVARPQINKNIGNGRSQPVDRLR